MAGMTIKQCFQRCKELWRWLEANPEKWKHQWPKWEKNGGKYEDEWGSNCFACNYVSQKYDVWEGELGCGINTPACPLYELWPNGCEQLPSPYTEWKSTSIEDRSKPAKQIADFCEMKLKEMEK